MSALTQAVAPQGLTLSLKTLTPFYTGGVAQSGEQLHPSGLLGSIRHFSRLLGNTLGDGGFDRRLWGQVDGQQTEHHAKRIGLRFDTGDLHSRPLPRQITCGRPRGWYFGTAQEGSLGLRLTPRTVLSDDDWNRLLVALRIQIRHASFGAKDQFGLGVMDAISLPDAHPLPVPTEQLPRHQRAPGLHRAFFARLVFDCPVPEDRKARLEAGLYWRLHLRNSLRGTEPYWQQVRHYAMGKLGRYGSAVNISAVYPVGDQRCAIRVWAVLPHTDSEPPVISTHRNLLRDTLRDALETGDGGPQLPCSRQVLEWQEWEPEEHPHVTDWINRLAGLSQ